MNSYQKFLMCVLVIGAFEFANAHPTNENLEMDKKIVGESLDKSAEHSDISVEEEHAEILVEGEHSGILVESEDPKVPEVEHSMPAEESVEVTEPEAEAAHSVIPAKIVEE